MAPWNFSWISQESFLTRSILWEDCLYIFVVKKNPTSVLALREACSRKACWRHPHFSCLKLALQHYRTVINKSYFLEKSLHGPSHEFLPLESTTQSSAFTPGQRKFISPELYLVTNIMRNLIKMVVVRK